MPSLCHELLPKDPIDNCTTAGTTEDGAATNAAEFGCIAGATARCGSVRNTEWWHLYSFCSCEQMLRRLDGELMMLLNYQLMNVIRIIGVRNVVCDLCLRIEG